MKAITVRQPWASLIACGAKKNETRSWYTKYRGPIAIHAGLYPLRKTLQMLPGNVVGCMKLMLKSGGRDTASRLDIHRLPLGCIVATAKLVDCIKVTKKYAEALDDYERMFGNYTIGGYAWVLEDIKPLERPIKVKGAQGLWSWIKGPPQ